MISSSSSMAGSPLKFLVTGGAGFIGSHLCDALRASGASVRVLDDFSTGRVANVQEGTEPIMGDVANLKSAIRAIDGVDGCFHLAAIASVPRSAFEWLETHRVNLTGTITLFEAIRRLERPIPVVLASSAAIYGKPLSAYGADKLGCEHHAKTATDIHDIPTACLRLFNVYGPRQPASSHYSAVISTFCRRILDHSTVDIHGTGEQSRDFIYVSDVVLAMEESMRRLLYGWLPSAPFDVCTGKATTILSLAQIIAEMAEIEPKLRFAPARLGDVTHSVGDRTAMLANLGALTQTKLRTGLWETLASLSPP